ncbi:MAG: HD domain-containing protein [Minicystis sp.]
MQQDLLDLLLALDGVRQDPRYHPEGDALYHSLQAFEIARRDSDDRALWAAALFHDVGKALRSPRHDEDGADLLEGILSPRIVWLVRHHLDLLHSPGPTKRRFRGTAELADLQRLRRWDVGGRSPNAPVTDPEDALVTLFDGIHLSFLTTSGEMPAELHDPRKEKY